MTPLVLDDGCEFFLCISHKIETLSHVGESIDFQVEEHLMEAHPRLYNKSQAQEHISIGRNIPHPPGWTP